MARTVTIAAPEEVVVKLRDPEKDVDRKYTLRTMTRSAKREVQAAQKKVAEASEAVSEDETTDEQEDAFMAAVCDLINVILTGPDSAPAAGDMLLDGWREDRVTDDQILQLMGDLSGVDQDPT